MEKIRIGIIGTSEIAYRRFLPSLKKSNYFSYVGIASRDINKTNKFIGEYGGKSFLDYDDLLKSDSIDAVYIPLPPALHFEWANKALDNNKHVFLEKPSVTKFSDCEFLIKKANEKDLAIHENYMFLFHNQLDLILETLKQNNIGYIRLIKISFGFPKRDSNDFRYNKLLGGGSLFDCGGYTIKLASVLLGDSMRVSTSNLNFDNSDVDIYGSATMINNEGMVAQVSFGMDNSYKCDLEIWGSNGTILAPRIFTAPSDFEPLITIVKNNETNIIKLGQCDQFLGSINYFYKCIKDKDIKIENQKQVLKQSQFIELIKNGGKV